MTSPTTAASTALGTLETLDALVAAARRAGGSVGVPPRRARRRGAEPVRRAGRRARRPRPHRDRDRPRARRRGRPGRHRPASVGGRGPHHVVSNLRAALEARGAHGRMPRMRIGVLTGGGDCPGLNAVIRGVVRAGVNRHGHEIVGFRYGWAGVLERNAAELTPQNTAGILHRGGTILGTSRTNPFKGDADGTAAVRETLEAERIDALIPIGGEDTLGVAGRLSADGIPVVGVPKTIDNDLAGTDVTFGFHTAVQIATDAIDRLHTTAESHNRVIVVEVMGRHAGWIAAYSGIAGGGDVILVPERPFDIDEVCERIKRRHARGTTFSIVVVSEGALPADGTGLRTMGSGGTDAFGHERRGGIAVTLETEIERRTGYETRMTI